MEVGSCLDIQILGKAPGVVFDHVEMHVNADFRGNFGNR